MKLRPYQKENSQSIIELWDKDQQSVIYQLPTGGGKTVVINTIVEQYLDEKILILVHRQEIIFQIRDRLRARGVDVGVLIGNYQENLEADIIVGSILTVARDTRLQGILDRDFDKMIIDEAHHACSDSYIKTITAFKNHNKNYRLLGVTATPYRKDGKKLSNIFDVMVKGPTYSQLRADGYLADYTCYAAQLDKLKEVELSGGDYKISSLSKFMRSEGIIQKAIEMYETKGEKKQMLVFCVDKKHTVQVKEAYEKAGYTKIAIIDSDTPDEERKQINEDYRNKKIDIIVSVQTLTEGVDLPETGVVQMLRPTLSVVLYLQILGRGTRLKSDGSKLIILDLSNCSYEHGLLDSSFDWTLNNDDPNPEKKLNKIVGKTKKGTYTADASEIEADYLEIEEMSHEDYLLQAENGIEEAENENKKKDQQIVSILQEMVDYLNQRCKVKNIKFTFSASEVFNYRSYDTIQCNLGDRDVFDLEYKYNKVRINSGWNYRFEGDLKETEKPILVGQAVEFLNKDRIIKFLLDKWHLATDIYDEKVDIRELKDKIQKVKEEKCVHLINEHLAEGKYVFELNREVPAWTYFRDISRFDAIEFMDKPKRLMSTNRIGFDGLRGYSWKDELSSVKKDVLIEILYKYWYLKDEK